MNRIRKWKKGMFQLSHFRAIAACARNDIYYHFVHASCPLVTVNSWVGFNC